VRRSVERVRGKIHVESTPGRGTAIVIRLPPTLAVIAGFVVAVGGELLVIPMSAVDECLELPEGDGDSTGVMYVRGEGVPFVALRSFFGFGGAWPGREVVVIVQHENGRAGLVVDEILGEAQIVIKPAGPVLRTVPGVTGTVVMGNGSVAMVIDPAAVIRKIERRVADVA
jgi:two-component system, chemotaxis family, sensor kinase CheA